LEFVRTYIRENRFAFDLYYDKKQRQLYNKARFVFSSLPQSLEYARPMFFHTPMISPVDTESAQSVKIKGRLGEFLDRNPNKKGTIVLAFGHHFNWANVPEREVEKFQECFEDLSADYNIVWQYNATSSNFGSNLTESSQNIYKDAWLPLGALMARKDAKLIIAHGGMKTVMEAIHFGVPLLTVPEKYDQYRVSNALLHRNLISSVDYNRLTSESLCETIRFELGKDHQKLQKHSQMMQWDKLEVPTSFYLKFAERHANVWDDWIRPKIMKLTFLQRNLLDVVLVLLTLLIIRTLV